MTSFLAPAAYCWGRIMGAYTLRAARTAKMTIVGEQHLPDEPAIYIGWHEANFVELTLMNTLTHRERRSFVPGGIVGAAMRGLLAGVNGVEPILLPEDEAGGVRAALRRMAAALDDGFDVVVACDGPAGPARQMKPGAIWLARMAGYPLVPVGCAASPSIRVPRWDRLLVPLPGARTVAVIDQPFRIERSERVDARLLVSIADRLNAATERAWTVGAQSDVEQSNAPVELMEDQ